MRVDCSWRNLENEGENEGAREQLPGENMGNAPNWQAIPTTPDLATPNRKQNCNAEMIGPIKTTRETDCILGEIQRCGDINGLTKINPKRVSVWYANGSTRRLSLV